MYTLHNVCCTVLYNASWRETIQSNTYIQTQRQKEKKERRRESEDRGLITINNHQRQRKAFRVVNNSSKVRMSQMGPTIGAFMTVSEIIPYDSKSCGIAYVGNVFTMPKFNAITSW